MDKKNKNLIKMTKTLENIKKTAKIKKLYDNKNVSNKNVHNINTLKTKSKKTLYFIGKLTNEKNHEKNIILIINETPSLYAKKLLIDYLKFFNQNNISITIDEKTFNNELLREVILSYKNIDCTVIMHNILNVKKPLKNVLYIGNKTHSNKEGYNKQYYNTFFYFGKMVLVIEDDYSTNYNYFYDLCIQKNIEILVAPTSVYNKNAIGNLHLINDGAKVCFDKKHLINNFK